MSIISLVAAVDQQGGLGYQNQLLCHLPADLKHFKALTIGKPVIMGRRTFESIGKPLPNRHNIVLTRSDLIVPDVTIVHSIEEAIMLTQDAPEIMVIGGAEIFRLFLPTAAQLFLTRIHHQFKADVFFPKVEWENWKLISTIEHEADINNRYSFTIQHYRKIDFSHILSV